LKAGQHAVLTAKDAPGCWCPSAFLFYFFDQTFSASSAHQLRPVDLETGNYFVFTAMDAHGGSGGGALSGFFISRILVGPPTPHAQSVKE
jgi:hypothetical protein